MFKYVVLLSTVSLAYGQLNTQTYKGLGSPNGTASNSIGTPSVTINLPNCDHGYGNNYFEKLKNVAMYGEIFRSNSQIDKKRIILAHCYGTTNDDKFVQFERSIQSYLKSERTAAYFGGQNNPGLKPFIENYKFQKKQVPPGSNILYEYFSTVDTAGIEEVKKVNEFLSFISSSYILKKAKNAPKNEDGKTFSSVTCYNKGQKTGGATDFKDNDAFIKAYLKNQMTEKHVKPDSPALDYKDCVTLGRIIASHAIAKSGIDVTNAGLVTLNTKDDAKEEALRVNNIGKDSYNSKAGLDAGVALGLAAVRADFFTPKKFLKKCKQALPSSNACETVFDESVQQAFFQNQHARETSVEKLVEALQSAAQAKTAANKFQENIENINEATQVDAAGVDWSSYCRQHADHHNCIGASSSAQGTGVGPKFANNKGIGLTETNGNNNVAGAPNSESAGSDEGVPTFDEVTKNNDSSSSGDSLSAASGARYKFSGSGGGGGRAGGGGAGAAGVLALGLSKGSSSKGGQGSVFAGTTRSKNSKFKSSGRGAAFFGKGKKKKSGNPFSGLFGGKQNSDSGTKVVDYGARNIASNNTVKKPGRSLFDRVSDAYNVVVKSDRLLIYEVLQN